MESSASSNLQIQILQVLYDFRYLWKDNREICVRKGEKLLLLEKTNPDWWQVVRPTERKSFFVPAQYVEILSKPKNIPSSSSGPDHDSVLYENLDSLKQHANVDLPSLPNVSKTDAGTWSGERKQDKQKPVPKTRTKVTGNNGDDGTAVTKLSNEKFSRVIDAGDKNDKLKINDKKSPEFVGSFLKDVNPSSVFQSDKNYRGRNAPGAVENFVYCNVPLGEGKVKKHRVQPSDIQSKIDLGKNRMKNSYNLKTKPADTPTSNVLMEVKQSTPTTGKDKLKVNHNFSKSLEKLAEEIQFEPKKVGGKSLSVDNYGKSKPVKMPKDNSDKRQEKKGKTNDASVVLDENKSQPQPRSVFSRFRRSLHHNSSFKSNNLKKLGKSSKKACELSLSWEGGLDKIQEKKEAEEKPQITPMGLQRSRTFMFPERSPLSGRPSPKLFPGKHRLDTAYHSQRKPDEKVTLSTFKPIFNLDVARQVSDSKNKPTFEKEKLQTSAEEGLGKKPVYENITKVCPKVTERSKTSGKEGLTFYTEPYSNSESDDNLEEKSLAVIAGKTLRSQSSVESNHTVSEETEASESDENCSPDLKYEKGGRLSSNQQINKRRTSLVRSSRVESSKARKVVARSPPTPSPEQKPLKDLGEGWGSYVAKSGRSYYYNEKTGEKNWKPPRKCLNAQEKRLVGSHESLCSDTNRSDTSSSLTENYQHLSSLSRSNGSLKSANLDGSSLDAPTLGSPPRCKGESLDNLNRSSYNSSPVTGLSQSSSYSLDKSSRDSLNRFSPIENIPSEEEGLELYDHVYQDESKKEKEKKLDERKSRNFDRVDTTALCIKPGWEEFYDENLDQIYYMYNNKKEKELKFFLMWPKYGFIPSDVAAWLEDVRRTVESYESTYDSNSSDDSIYDNVERLAGKATNVEFVERSTLEEKFPGNWFYSTWPLWENLEIRAVKIPKDCLACSNIRFNWPWNNSTRIKCTASDTSVEASKDVSLRQESRQPNLFASMSNLLARHREMHTQECVRTWLNGENLSCEDILESIKNDVNYLEKRMTFIDGEKECVNERVSSHNRKSLPAFTGNDVVREKPPVPPKRKMSHKIHSPPVRRLRKNKPKPVGIPIVYLKKTDGEVTPEEILKMTVDESVDETTKKPLPFPAYSPELEYEINELLMMERVTESSKERRRISIERKSSPILERPIAQGYVTNISEAPSPLLSMRPSHKGKMSKLELGVDNLSDPEGQNKVIQFLENRKRNSKYKPEPKIPLKLREDIIIDWENDYENLNEPVVLEGKSVVFKRVLSVHPKIQVHMESIPTDEETISSMEEISTMSETSLPSPSNVQTNRSPKASLRSKIIEIVARYDKILKECDPKSDTETFDKISVSSISDGLNSFSDFESDINETIAVGESWCNENSSDENASLISWDVSEDLSISSERLGDEDSGELKLDCGKGTEVKLDTIFEGDEKFSDKRSSGLASFKEPRGKAKSESDLRRCRSMSYLNRSKSVGAFRNFLEDGRSKPGEVFKKHDSITSDVCEWMAKIRGIAFPEDQLFSDDNEWILSFDSEERAYFFEETSKKSLWTLPDYSSEKPDTNYAIQRSATESAINNESPTKLRISKDGVKGGKVSARSSKAQSMLIEPKLDLSAKDGNKTFSMPRDLSKIFGEIIRIGVLNKTKISESGKRLRKNWTPAFVVLTNSYLFFFKDAKSFQNMKNVIGSNGNHMCLSLQGAVIEKGDKISSRKNVYKISCSDNLEVLIQTDKTSEAEEWFKEIGLVIQKLPQDPATARGSPLLDSKPPSKVGRTKSLKVKNKESGSMEDLSSNPEERQNKIKARLKKFFNRRPTVDSLKKKGIWKDEPVFGCSLEQITRNRNPRVPVFVEKCIECIESKEENMKTDGLYRASGNLSQVQKIRLEVDQNNLNIMKEEEDVHVLTGSLKLFFRELKEPLIPSKQLEPALLATDKQTKKERIKDFQKIVKSLPIPNYDTLKFLLQHLLRVKEYHKYNRMNINNLAIVFGPTLMWPEQESANMALELMQQNVVIECLLKEFQEIFT